jgi:hypothetical protein
MSIPETQLERWSHQGSITQSAQTYNSIKGVLEAQGTPYAGKDFSVFLQGSYGNDTNIYAESDVDIVIQCNAAFYYDIDELSEGQKAAFHATYPGTASYGYDQFKSDVVKVLKTQYGDAVTVGPKAIAIAAGGSRRKADVIAALQHRRYWKFIDNREPSYHEGICFFATDGTKIANFPKQHSANLTRKHQASGQWYKPLVRIVKNARERLKDDGVIKADVAPSYYLEGLLYNVPIDLFGASYSESLKKALEWLSATEKKDFVCANERYYLLRENSPVTWRAAKCDEFLAAMQELWENWYED